MDLVSCAFVGALALARSLGGAAGFSDIEAALDRWQPDIEEAARRFAIPASWIRDVMRLESAGRPFTNERPTTSTAGAMGLMQLMPATYAELRERYGFGVDPYEARDNIFAGAAYLHELYERYGWPSLFAAYHAGPGRLEDYLATGRPLPAATRQYVAALTSGRSTNPPMTPSSIASATLFVSLSRADRSSESVSTLSPDDRLFVRLGVTAMGVDEHVGSRGASGTEALDVRVP